MTTIEQVLSGALLGADEADVYAVRGEEVSIIFKMNEHKWTRRRSVQGIGLRVIKEGRLGFSTTTDMRRSEVLVSRALESCNFGPGVRFELPSLLEPSSVRIFDERVEKYTAEEGEALARDALDFIRSECPEARTDLHLRWDTQDVTIMNSKGLRGHYRKTMWISYIDAQIEVDGEKAWIWEGTASCRMWDSLLPLLEGLIQKIKWSIQKASVSPGLLPIIVMPKCAYFYLVPLQTAVNAKRLQLRQSVLAGKLGEQLVDPSVTVFDDGTLDWAPGSAPFDEEGIATRRTTVIDRGVLSSYLYDLQTSANDGTASTGHGRREFDSLPSPGVTNFVLEPRNQSLAELIESVDEGLLVDQTMGGPLSSFPTGDIRVSLDLAFKIENGTICGRVGSGIVSGNIFDLLRRVRGIGNKAEVAPGRIVAPPVCLDGASVLILG